MPALALAACGLVVPDDRPLAVSAVGGPPRLGGTDPASRLFTDATAQGLVRFDAAGQIETGLAERWIVIDQGRSYIFRLREARWADNRPIDATEVARLIGRRSSVRSANPLAPYLTAVAGVVAMTPQVIELRLARPRPDLLKLFAQPEMALTAGTPRTGSGPMRIAEAGPTPLLRPAPDPDRVDTPPSPAADVRLSGERTARAVARFAAGGGDAVLGGTFTDWPLVEVASLRRGAVRFDPAAGLFGLSVVARTGFLADPANRAAVSQAMDRTAAAAAIGPGVDPVDRLLPDGLDSASPPHVADWTLRTDAERVAAARARVVAWGGGPVALRVALPAGPGATRLWGVIAASLLRVGIEPRRVPAGAPADLRLLDAVAPYDNARWYLAAACRPCGPAAFGRLEAARTAATLAERARHTAEADAAIDADASFIPLARPFRWSLVGPRATGWQPNARAWHPLNHLRASPD